MAALTAPRDTKYYEIIQKDWLPVAAGVRLWAGGIVAANAAGYAVPASADVTQTAAGRAEHSLDNALGASGDLKVEIRRGVFLYANGTGGDAITMADRFKDCFIIDDQTVGKTNGSGARPRAGKVVRVEPAGVWVYINPLAG
jgi:hypothetical protein